MNILSIISQPFLLGLSSGLFCLSYCVPFVAPYLVSEKRPWKKSIVILGQFIGGRLLGYLVFGAIIGYLGFQFNTLYVNILANLSLLLMSAVMILYALNVIRWKKQKLCAIRFPVKKVPFLLGLLTGINFCPPFILALNLVFTLHNTLAGVVFFAFFFLGTAIYLIPLLFIAPLGYINYVRKAARFAALVIGIIYLFYEFFYFYRGLFIFKMF
ncbi:sulfite exporter TauE/SafE family protein [Patescibacteria group bacterium]|nr:sulfite exporter TauE/SafE family protein [Patescibacteria group bacterium]MBU4512243.1 sulfite exporter TauE/SafE family protein [Patescibacteria group bacterium]MCG2692661.1 sulfite exporter TauE/SafE family protein [Candidatus Parcubacteria bacterium]